MKTGRVRGIETPISRVVLGTAGMSTRDPSQAFAVLDEYVATSGNCLDTAWIYGGGDGSSEQVVGDWFTRTGTRDDVVLIGKGACSISCTPDLVTKELNESLERLQTDSVDLYLLHRDNPDVPAGEFVEALNDHRRAGRMKAFGASNWRTERIAEANAYAAEHGIEGFAASSANFSLAVWNEPTWEHTVGASDPSSRRWYEGNDVALFAWSSQAGGFFTGRYGEWSINDPDAADMVRVWFNNENFERLSRARELGQKRGVDPTAIALAYVLCQKFEVFALIGPLTPGELHSSLAAADLVLSPEELAYLDLKELVTQDADA